MHPAWFTYSFVFLLANEKHYLKKFSIAFTHLSEDTSFMLLAFETIRENSSEKSEFKNRPWMLGEYY